MNDQRFDRLLRETAEEYNRPPEAPTDAMWAEIQRRRENPVVRKPVWRRPMVLAPVAAAAILLLGIGLGRWSFPDPTDSDGPAQTTPDSADPRSSDGYFRVAAERHLEQTEALFSLFALDSTDTDGFEREQRVYQWATRLLDDTRLLMDSPAAEDPALEKLLTDLELYLARIVRASGGRLEHEKERINDDLRRQGVLMRLQSQLPAGHV